MDGFIFWLFAFIGVAFLVLLAMYGMVVIKVLLALSFASVVFHGWLAGAMSDYFHDKFK